MTETLKELQVEVVLLPTGGGGRSTPANLSSGYRPLVAAGHHGSLKSAAAVADAVFGVEFSRGPILQPGDAATATIRALIFPEGLRAIADSGVFTIFEGRRAVGHGRVVDDA